MVEQGEKPRTFTIKKASLGSLAKLINDRDCNLLSDGKIVPKTVTRDWPRIGVTSEPIYVVSDLGGEKFSLTPYMSERTLGHKAFENCQRRFSQGLSEKAKK